MSGMTSSPRFLHSATRRSSTLPAVVPAGSAGLAEALMVLAYMASRPSATSQEKGTRTALNLF